jgi:FG-GAP-like repeat/Aldos-2-ulose dehydratase, beta-propeller domain
MRLKHLPLLVTAVGVAGASLFGSRPPSDPVEFRPHVVDANIPGGYAVATVDMNKDGKPDVIGVTQRVPELAWYENPTWQRHIITDGMPAIVNLAAADIDDDGIPELALESAFAMVPAKSEGLVWLLRHQGNPREHWKAQRIDAFSTSHHIAWADIDGDGKKELINAPLIGPKGLAPTYDQDKASLFWYRQGQWQRQLIADDITGILHRVRPVFWDDDRRSELLTASFDGITLYRASGRGANLKWEVRRLASGHIEKAPRLGSSDVAVGHINRRRFLASVEPWHGNEIVVYTENGGTWQRRVLFDGLLEGHEIAVADFNRDGRDDIVAGDRDAKTTGVHVLYAPDDVAAEWHHQILDAGTMAASGCVTADINADGRPDIVCIGSSTANIKWYENVAAASPSSIR